MESYSILYNNELIGKIKLPIGNYSKTELIEKLKNKCDNNIFDDMILTIKVSDINEVFIKARSYTTVETILKSVCERQGLNSFDYNLKHELTILPLDKGIGFFAEDQDVLHLVHN